MRQSSIILSKWIEPYRLDFSWRNEILHWCFPWNADQNKCFSKISNFLYSYWVCCFLCFQLAAERSIKFFETSAFSNINVDEVCTCKSSYCQLIAHFQVALILSCFKVSVLGQLAFHVKSSSIHSIHILTYLHVKKTNFCMKGFALGLTLKQKQNGLVLTASQCSSFLFMLWPLLASSPAPVNQ